MLSVISALLDGILSVITLLLNGALAPVNLIFTELFPDMTNAISTFNTFVITYLGNNLSYFFNILPSIFTRTLLVWFSFLIAYYSIYYTYNLGIKIFEIIQKIKFW